MLRAALARLGSKRWCRERELRYAPLSIFSVETPGAARAAISSGSALPFEPHRVPANSAPPLALPEETPMRYLEASRRLASVRWGGQLLKGMLGEKSGRRVEKRT
jgi:hypothetical protein